MSTTETLNKDLVKMIVDYDGKRSNYITFINGKRSDTINLSQVFRISSDEDRIKFYSCTDTILYVFNCSHKLTLNTMYKQIINHLNSEVIFNDKSI